MNAREAAHDLAERVVSHFGDDGTGGEPAMMGRSEAAERALDYYDEWVAEQE